MKINFHYFTIKFIAVKAGYRIEDAELIASTCQFINDNYRAASLRMQYDDLSEAIKDRKLFEEDVESELVVVPLLLTALNQQHLQDEMENETIQKNRLIPFYYFPEAPPNSDLPEDEKTKYRVQPITMSTGSINNIDFKSLYDQAKEKYNQAIVEESSEDENIRELGEIHKNQALRRLAVLLHIMTDSHAYVPFNGYCDTLLDWKINEVKHSTNYSDLTEQYEPSKYKKYENIGKYRTGTVTEDYNRQFNISRSYGEYVYKRINNDMYTKAANNVYFFLADFHNQPPSEFHWRDNILPKLKQCWNIEDDAYEQLRVHWQLTTNIDYDYDQNLVRALITKLDDNIDKEEQSYFDFLLMLQDVIDTTNKRLEGTSDMDDNKILDEKQVNCIISEPYFRGENFEITVTALSALNVKELTMLVTLYDVDKETNLYSKPYNFYNVNSVNEKICYTIPESDLNTLVKINFISNNESITFKKLIEIKGNASLIENYQLLEPSCKQEDIEDRKYIKIVNGNTALNADYNYPLNTAYTSAEDKDSKQLDIYTPIHLQLKLADNVMLMSKTGFQAEFTLTSANGSTYTYCNDQRYITLAESDNHHVIDIKAVEEWKNRLPINEFVAKAAIFQLSISFILNVFSTNENGYRKIKFINTPNKAPLATIEYKYI